jgi:hypothetical protein
MRRYLVSALILLGLILAPASAQAQGNTTGLVVSTCNSPTFTAGNPGPFTVDAHGNLCTNGTGGGGGSVTQGTTPWVSSITAWGGGTLGAMANYGTSPGAVLVPGVNAFVTSSALPTGAATSALQTTGNTALTTINTTLGTPFQAGGSIGNTSFAVTNAGTFASQITGWGGGTLGAMANYGTSPGAVLAPGVNAFVTNSPTVSGTGTAGTAATGVLTVQGIASMTKLLVTPDSVALPANQSVNLAQVAGQNTINGGANGSLAIGGTVATNVAITENPVNIGAQAVSSENTAVTATRQAQLVADLTGRLITFPMANKENLVSGTTAAMTGTTSTAIIAAITSNKIYVTSISCMNSHATVGTFVTIQDGSGGTALATLAAAAVFGGAVLTGTTPLFSTTSGNGLYAADVTTGANVICNASGFKGT